MSTWKETLRKWCLQTEIPSGWTAISLRDYSLVPLAVAQIVSQRQGSLLVVVADAAKLDALSNALDTYRKVLGDPRPLIPLPEVAISRSQWVPENEAGRCAALEAALNQRVGIYLTTVQVLLSSTLSPRKFRQNSFTLKRGMTISPEALAAKLVELDYDNEFEVQTPGDFARRGGVFDIYSPLYEEPVRLEFWGDEIDSLRFFLPDTQRSFKDAQEITIVPRGTAVFGAEDQEQTLVREFFAPEIPLVLCSPRLLTLQLEGFADSSTRALWPQILQATANTISLLTEPDEEKPRLAPAAPEGVLAPPPAPKRRRKKSSEETPAEPEQPGLLPCTAMALEAEQMDSQFATLNLQLLRDNLKRWATSGFTIVACCSSQGGADRFRTILKEHPDTAKLKIIIEELQLDTGILFPDQKLVLLSDREIFGHTAKTRRYKHINYRFDTALRDNIDLEEGELAVHAAHGICKFHGIIKKPLGTAIVEAIDLEFADDARLYVPLEQAHLVSRYIGGTKNIPSLSSLNSAAWNRKCKQAADAAWDLAADLLRLEAVRSNAQGIRLNSIEEWEIPFAASFPYTETTDQTKAIKEVMDDLASTRPMDRLLCGDVGYGKTEVGIRAAFRAVMNGYQVAVLVPTTVLAQQHFQSFQERMSNYPIKIEMLSRFRTPREQKDILERLARGDLDIIIGTHALLQPDVKFANLGLLIIDEEQRFGVKHKQRLKQMRTTLDILTMTATPIPRTLYFSLSGLRNLSTIMTPPADRLPVTTIVANYDKELIKQAILRELERKGQVFFLYNRVETIGKIRDFLEELVPQARFAVAHGQMSGGQLENIMTRFVRKEYDVLICTTIIESGIDIPNVNTIIIDRADRFGLSELYQLRGRVGRYHRQAYAYLLLPPMGSLPANARQRLDAIRKYTHLGAGFKLAMKDLEIRGAGNILGEEQSGHIAAVGFELYCQLLKEAVARLEKQEIPRIIEVHVDFDTVTGSINPVPGLFQATISPDYITDELARIDCYKRLHALASSAEIDAFGQELEDRFGPLPPATSLLLQLSKIRALAAQKHLVRLTVRQQRLLMETGSGLYKPNGRGVPLLASDKAPEQAAEILTFLQNYRPGR